MHYRCLGDTVLPEDNQPVVDQSLPEDDPNRSPAVTVAQTGNFIQDGISKVKRISQSPDFVPSAIIGAVAAILALKILK